jgi:pyrroline-5-carboxylate reductase
MDNSRILFIGCGNMGRSLMGGLIADGYNKNLITGIDPQPEQRNIVENQFGISCFSESTASNVDVDYIVLAVKPQVMKTTLLSMRSLFENINPAIISIAAGIQIRHISTWLDKDLAIARVMPNTPSLLRAGAAGMFANAHISTQQRKEIQEIMLSVGTASWVKTESHIDAVTALSGSGPAYFFLFVELIEKAATDLGLDKQIIHELAVQTVLGSAKMMSESDLSPAELRKQVTSPGGTTESALNKLMDGQLEGLINNALQAAHQRSVELASELEENS